MPRSRYSDDTSDEEYGTPVAVISTPRSHHGSTHSHRRHQEPTVILTEKLLTVPEHGGSRHRSSSQGAAPQPQFIVNMPGRNESHERHRRGRSRGSRSSRSSEYDDEEIIRYRQHHHPSSHRGSDLLDEETIRKLERLRMLEREREGREQEEHIKAEVEREKLKEELKEKREKDKQREYVEKWKREEAERKEKQKKAEQEEKEKFLKWKREEQEKAEKAKKDAQKKEKEFEEQFILRFMQAGYTAEAAERILNEKKRKEKSNELAIDLSRPTWIKVHRQWLLPETLDAYLLPWEWDDVSTSQKFLFILFLFHALQLDYCQILTDPGRLGNYRKTPTTLSSRSGSRSRSRTACSSIPGRSRKSVSSSGP